MRGPTARLMIATTTTITMSRLITRIVSQAGRWLVSGIVGRGQHDERGDEQQLVRHRIEPCTQARALTSAPRDEPVQGIGNAGDEERYERPPEIAVHHEQHKRWDQHDPENRELVRDGENAHGTAKLSAERRDREAGGWYRPPRRRTRGGPLRSESRQREA